MAEANRFLREEYLPEHNRHFSRPPEEKGSAFVPFAGPALADILCLQEERTVANDNTVSYRGLSLQIPPDQHRFHYVRVKVRVHEYMDGSMAVFHGPRCLARYQRQGAHRKTQEEIQRKEESGITRGPPCVMGIEARHPPYGCRSQFPRHRAATYIHRSTDVLHASVILICH